ncbi:15496_t:CDS:2, partial [Gigaspora margarita]
LVKRYNRTLCEALAKLTKQEQEWDILISLVLYVYRTSKQATTKFTPFYLIYEKEACFSNFREENNIDKNIVDRLTIFIEELPICREKKIDNMGKDDTWDDGETLEFKSMYKILVISNNNIIFVMDIDKSHH